jgi:hypothetical protein
MGADHDLHRRLWDGLCGDLLGHGTWRATCRRGLAQGGKASKDRQRQCKKPLATKRVTIGGMEKSLLDPRNGLAQQYKSGKCTG